MRNKTVDRDYLEKLGRGLIETHETGEFGLSEEARECLEAENNKDSSGFIMLAKSILNSYCLGYAIGYLRAKNRRIVTADIENE